MRPLSLCPVNEPSICPMLAGTPWEEAVDMAIAMARAARDHHGDVRLLACDLIPGIGERQFATVDRLVAAGVVDTVGINSYPHTARAPLGRATLKSWRQYKLPILVAETTFVSERSLASSLGAADYVTKPVQWENFRVVMDRFREETGDVFVVDDDEDARTRVRQTLEKDGWSVAEAGNGREALDRIAVARPRVVLLDLTMPVMDGFAFLDALRSCPCGADIPVIVLSARDLTREERTRLDSAERVMTKGDVSLKDVATKIRAVAE